MFNLFGKREPKSDEALRMEAEAVLREAAQLEATDRKKAMKTFFKAFEGGNLEPLIDFGGPMHDEAQAMLSRLTDTSLEDLPAVTVFDAPEDGVLLREQAAISPAGLGYVRYTKAYHGHRAALAAMEAQRIMRDDAAIAAAAVGESHFLLRNAVLVQVLDQLGGPPTEKRFQRELDDILVGRLGCGEGDFWNSPLGYEIYVYRMKS